jgi:hypothetical protein
MGTISTQAASIFRNFNTLNDPSSGVYNPDKDDIIALLQLIDAMLTAQASVSANYALSDSDRLVRVDASGGARTITVAPSLQSFLRTIVKSDASANEVIITADGATPLRTLTLQGASQNVTPNGSGLDFS